ncbi:MAG: hypothetical protein COB07_03720 [Sulfurovum sp.]|nr:MAG: hypothetical protein COB07_03720 [Sulfurovum sp.]
MSSLLISTAAMAFGVKVEKPVVVKGSSIGTYAKPGAPVDISYESEHVDTGDTSNINIILTSSTTTGTMKVKVKVDKDLHEISKVKKHLSYDLSESKKEYPLHLEVSADEEGLYYIRVLVSIKGQGMRAFAVPVYVGDAVLKTKKTAGSYSTIEKTDKGGTISVSAAQESITEE